MANVVDALVYASIKNNVSTDADGINSIIQYTSGLIPAQTGATIGPTLNGILDDTAIKRACCLGKGTVDVRIPIPKEIQLGTVLSSDVLQKKFGYYDKTVTVPKELCPKGYNRIDTPNDNATINNCDVFYKTYCQNAIASYNKMVTSMGGTFKPDDFILFKPECACFVPANSYGLDGTGFNVVPKCWYTGCDAGSFNAGKIWLDSASRGTQNCDITYCKNIMEFNNLTAGGNINITPKIVNMCGPQVTAAPTAAPTTAPPTKAPTAAATTAPTTAPTNAPTTAPSGGSSTTKPSSTSTTTPTPTSALSNIIPSSITGTSGSSNNMYIIIGVIICVILMMCSAGVMMMMD